MGVRWKYCDVKGLAALVLMIVVIVFLALGLRNLLQNRENEVKEKGSRGDRARE